MAEQNKRKGRKTATSRTFIDEEPKDASSGNDLMDLYDTFMRAKELDGLREWTLKDHRTTFKYFTLFLNERYPDLHYAEEITIDVIRDYVYYMSKRRNYGTIIHKLPYDIKLIKRACRQQQ